MNERIEERGRKETRGDEKENREEDKEGREGQEKERRRRRKRRGESRISMKNTEA